jgi:hypothetical protein
MNKTLISWSKIVCWPLFIEKKVLNNILFQNSSKGPLKIEDPRGSFHQHFTGAFLPISFDQKITKPNCNERNAVQFAFVPKTCYKILMKTTLGQWFSTQIAPRPVYLKKRISTTHN